jgi:hypothetical protein
MRVPRKGLEFVESLTAQLRVATMAATFAQEWSHLIDCWGEQPCTHWNI